MDEVGGENQVQRMGMLIGILAALFILRRLRKRRKQKKLLKARAKARMKLEEKRRKELVARKQVVEKTRKKRGKKGKKERSLTEQLIRFAVFQFMKKLISQQIKQMEMDMGSSKLGKKITEAAESTA
jgi:predicted AAA+ superfamily ATPase